MSQDNKPLPYENLYERKGIEKNIKEANDFVNNTLQSRELRDYFSKKFDPEIQDFWLEVFWNTGNELRFPTGRHYTPLDMVNVMSYNVSNKTSKLGEDISNLEHRINLSYEKNDENKLKMLENLNNYYTSISEKLDTLSTELNKELNARLRKEDKSNSFRGGRKRQSRKNKRKSVKGKLAKRKLAKMKTYRGRY